MTLGVTAVALAVAGAGPYGAAAAAETHSMIFYAKVIRVQFINHDDDRQRGNLTNPFNADARLPPPPNANVGTKGARAGDNALFSFNLYSDAKLVKPVGSGVYSCTFNFAHRAICEADFELRGGTMFASGPADLDTGEFTLPVSGGTGAYLGARGEFTSRPAARRNAHRLTFVLLK
jgi:hypothetical protein